MIFQLFFSIGLHLLLPLYFLVTLIRGRHRTKLEGLLDAAYSTLFFVFIFQIGTWSWVGYYLRYIWIILLLAALYYVWQKMRDKPFRTAYDWPIKTNMFIFTGLIVLFAVLNVLAMSGLYTKEEAIDLEMPLKNGTYYVGQGGDHALVNGHQGVLAQQYALDILKLNTFGVRAAGVRPKQLEKYYIYGETIYSPCDGKVVEVRNTMGDLIPPNTEPVLLEGNFVSMTCDALDEDTIIYLAHMQEGSVEVEPGMQVTTKDSLGLVGNTGNTTEPHLHIHAERDGIGIPIHFQDRFPVRNSLIREAGLES